MRPVQADRSPCGSGRRSLARLPRSSGTSNGPPVQSVDDVARFLADPCNFQIVAEEENRLVSSTTMMYRPWNDSYELGRATHPPRLSPPRPRRPAHVNELSTRSRRRGSAKYSLPPSAPGVLSIPCAALYPPDDRRRSRYRSHRRNGSREPHLMMLSIPEHARFVHVTPPVAERASGAFIREGIYCPLRLRLAPGEYSARVSCRRDF